MQLKQSPEFLPEDLIEIIVDFRDGDEIVTIRVLGFEGPWSKRVHASHWISKVQGQLDLRKSVPDSARKKGTGDQRWT